MGRVLNIGKITVRNLWTGPYKKLDDCLDSKLLRFIQARIAQLVAYRLGTRVVPGSNPREGENFSVKISN